MKLKRDLREEERFYALLRKHLHENDRVNGPKEFHVSDLMTPRRWYWNLMSPKEFTKEQVGFFLGGQAHHAIAEIILAGKDGSREFQALLEKDGIKITGTMDAKRKVPIEFKTSRKWTIPEDPADHYIDQLMFYCALTGSNKGKVVVFYLTPGRKWDGKNATGPEIAAWSFEFTDEELEEGRNVLLNTAKACLKAREEETPEILPLCEEWMCGTKYKGKVKINCPHYKECQPEGRYPESKIK